MRIALNALSAKYGGGVSVFQNLLPSLAHHDQSNNYFVFYSSHQQQFTRFIPGDFQKIIIRFIPQNPFLRILWEQCVFPFYLLWYKIDLLYAVGNTTTLFAPCKIILLIENANPYSLLKLPLTRKEHIRNIFLYFLGKFSIYRANKIRFVSENSKKIILQQMKIPLSKCVVIPHGIPEHTPFSEKKDSAEKPYLLTIGVNAPHRNTERLLEAFAILKKKYNYQGNLVILGHTGSRHRAYALFEKINKLELDTNVFFKNEVPHQEIPSYFVNAEILVFPSVEETFGLPLIEAMSLGIPIVASDCNLNPYYRGKCFSPFREICEDAACYFDPFQTKTIADALHQVITHPGYQKQLREKGKIRVQEFQLKHVVLSLIKLFEDTASNRT